MLIRPNKTIKLNLNDEIVENNLCDIRVIITDIINMDNIDRAIEIIDRVNKLKNKNITISVDASQELIDRLSILDLSKIDIKLIDNTAQDVLDLSKLSHANDINVPLSKIMWISNYTGNAWNVDVSSIKEAQEYFTKIITKNFPQYEKLTDIEKIVAVDSFIQRNVQYADNKGISKVLGKTYLSNFDMTWSDQFPIDVLSNHAGVCAGIAKINTLLLNNPLMNVRCYLVSAFGHSWNEIILNDILYIHDTTRNITRGQHRFEDALQATGYNYGATLSTAKRLDEEILNNEAVRVENGEESSYLFRTDLSNYPRAKSRYNVTEIERAVKSLVAKGYTFDFPNTPYYEQTLDNIVDID